MLEPKGNVLAGVAEKSMGTQCSPRLLNDVVRVLSVCISTSDPFGLAFLSGPSKGEKKWFPAGLGLASAFIS